MTADRARGALAVLQDADGKFICEVHCGYIVEQTASAHKPRRIQAQRRRRAMQEEHDAQEAEEGLKRPVEKTLIGDCRKCWCDQCAKLEQCVHLREGALPDGVRPFPCVGCADGMRFKPCEEERCADFEQGAGFNNG